jgi:hypothetical protein
MEIRVMRRITTKDPAGNVVTVLEHQGRQLPSYTLEAGDRIYKDSDTQFRTRGGMLLTVAPDAEQAQQVVHDLPGAVR